MRPPIKLRTQAEKAEISVYCYNELTSDLTLLHLERPKLDRVLAVLSAKGLSAFRTFM